MVRHNLKTWRLLCCHTVFWCSCMFLLCNIWHACVCTHTRKEPTITGHQGSVGVFIQCSAHEGKTGASVKHVEVDWPAPPQNFSYGGHNIYEEDQLTVNWLPAIQTQEYFQIRLPSLHRTCQSLWKPHSGTLRQAVYTLYLPSHCVLRGFSHMQNAKHNVNELKAR